MPGRIGRSEIASRLIGDAWSTRAPTPDSRPTSAAHYPWSEVARRTAEAYEQVAR